MFGLRDLSMSLAAISMGPKEEFNGIIIREAERLVRQGEFGDLRKLYIHRSLSKPSSLWRDQRNGFIEPVLERKINPKDNDVGFGGLPKENRKIGLQDLYVPQLREEQDWKWKYVSLLIVGDAGMGKTTLVKHALDNWSREGESPYCEHLINKWLVVYVNKSNERSTFEETLADATRSIPDKEENDVLYVERKFRDDTFIFFDELDQFSNPSLIAEILKRAKDRRSNIVVTCRKHHPYINNKWDYFSQVVEVQGFDRLRSKEFAKQFMEALNKRMPKKYHKDLFKRFDEHFDYEDQHLLASNPYNLSLICYMYAEKIIDDDLLSSINGPIELHEIHSKYILRKERRCVELQNQIHKVALHSLLQKDGYGNYSAGDLESMDIYPGSPLMKFFEKKERYEWNGMMGMTCSSYHWLGRPMCENLAAKSLMDNTVLNCVAGTTGLDHVIKYLIPSMADSEFQLAVDLLTAYLVLQGTPISCKSKNPQCSISAVRDKVRDPRRFLKHLIQKGKPVIKNRVAVINDLRKGCITDDWLVEQTMNSLCVLDSLVEIIKACRREETQQALSDAVLKPLFPAISRNNDLFSSYIFKDMDGSQETRKNLAAQSVCNELHAVPGRPSIVKTILIWPGPFGRNRMLQKDETKNGAMGQWILKVDDVKDLLATLPTIRISAKINKTHAVGQWDLNFESMNGGTFTKDDTVLLKMALFKFARAVRPKDIRLHMKIEDSWLNDKDWEFLSRKGLERLDVRLDDPATSW